jgi:hypothetical protein
MMADNQISTDARATYDGFVTLFKWGTLATVIVVAFVILVIS